jgi:hypothetical protein
MVDWTTQDGRKIPIKEMSESHLDNTINYLKERIEKIDEYIYDGYSFLGISLGDMSSYYVEQDISVLEELKENSIRWLNILQKEEKRRLDDLYLNSQ